MIVALIASTVFIMALVIELLESDGQLENGILEQLVANIVSQEYYLIHLALRLIEVGNSFRTQSRRIL